METKELLEEALQLRPQDKFILLDGLIKSLDEPDKNLEEIWAEEAEKRLRAYRLGKLEGIPMEEVFDNNFDSLIISKETKEQLEQAIREFKDSDILATYNLQYKKKILLCGKPGTGKTFSAQIRR